MDDETIKQLGEARTLLMRTMVAVAARDTTVPEAQAVADLAAEVIESVRLEAVLGEMDDESAVDYLGTAASEPIEVAVARRREAALAKALRENPTLRDLAEEMLRRDTQVGYDDYVGLVDQALKRAGAEREAQRQRAARAE